MITIYYDKYNLIRVHILLFLITQLFFVSDFIFLALSLKMITTL